MADPSPPVAPDAILPADGRENGADAPSPAVVGGVLAPRDSGRVGDAGSGGATPGASAALSTRKSRDAALIAKVDARVKRNAQRIVDAALKAPDLPGPDAADKPEGWSDRDFRTAKAAWLPLKQQPGFLAMAQRTLESYKKAEADKPPPPVINAELVQVHVSVENYPRRRLSEE